MKTHHPILITSITAAAALAQRRFVGFDGDVCAAEAKALGVTEYAADSGDQASVNASGVILVEAGGAIAVGAQVESDANGKAVTIASGASNGYALDAAAADGDVIRIARGI
ncbi:MAG: DUF2190 domain-containing protein [Oceanospirillaceae bacterium]|nr:DUF2190 domain-containing protein [Oceanospirillaceae bacterium]|tara:strand:- start:7980 stop:8312 length:333 start_codon:yes stop_codon:yes gene_type:complete